MNSFDVFAIGTTDYKNNFWNIKMKGKPTSHDVLFKGKTHRGNVCSSL